MVYEPAGVVVQWQDPAAVPLHYMLQDTWLYDPARNTWTLLPSAAPEVDPSLTALIPYMYGTLIGRYVPGFAAAPNGRIYLYGGDVGNLGCGKQ